jgi:hypothetical protein
MAVPSPRRAAGKATLRPALLLGGGRCVGPAQISKDFLTPRLPAAKIAESIVATIS